MYPFYSTNKKFLVKPEMSFSSKDVCLAENVDTGETLVVKMVRPYTSPQKDLIMWNKKLTHPNIINFYETDKVGFDILMFMPRYDFNLNSYIVSQGMWDKGFEEDEAWTIFMELCKAVEFIHGNKIAHRDIKLENYLVKKVGDDIQIVLADFGFAYDWSKEPEYVNHRGIGSPIYMSPELYVSKHLTPDIPNDPYKVSSPDIWALGVCFYILLYGHFPFYGKTKRDVVEKILKYEYSFSKDISYNENIQDIFVSHENRPSIEEIF